MRNDESLEKRILRYAAREPLLREIVRAARDRDASVWLVGGPVRDVAMGRAVADLDLAAGSGAAALLRELERTWSRRVFRFRKRGVTTWRFDVEGRKVDLVDVRRRGIERDLNRRDLRINAVAFDLRTGRILDPVRGLRDIDHELLEIPRSGIVREDPVRILRYARFLAELPGFRIGPRALREARAAAASLRRSSVERVREELDRLLSAKAPQRGLTALASWGALPAVLPELVPLASCVAGADRPDVWHHTLDALAVCAAPRGPGFTAVARESLGSRALRWALLLHDISKPETLASGKGGRPTFHGHEVLGARRAEAVLTRLRFPKAFRRRVRALVLHHLRPGHLADSGASSRALRRLLDDAGPDLPLLVAHAACDARASGGPAAPARWRRLRAVLTDLVAHFEATRRSPLPALVDGHDVMEILGIPPGPDVGRLLDEIRSLQEDGAILDRAAAVAHLRR